MYVGNKLKKKMQVVKYKIRTNFSFAFLNSQKPVANKVHIAWLLGFSMNGKW
jgi:hypothetical protein